MKMPTAADCKMRTRRMRHHQIPSSAKHLLNGLLQMPAWVAFALQQVAAPRVMAAAPEGIANAGAVFAGDKHAHKKEPRGAQWAAA